jgi:hypothetical protein
VRHHREEQRSLYFGSSLRLFASEARAVCALQSYSEITSTVQQVEDATQLLLQQKLAEADYQTL